MAVGGARAADLDHCGYLQCNVDGGGWRRQWLEVNNLHLLCRSDAQADSFTEIVLSTLRSVRQGAAADP